MYTIINSMSRSGGLMASDGGGWRRRPLFLEVGRQHGWSPVEFWLQGHRLRQRWVLGKLLILSAGCERLSSGRATMVDRRQARGGFRCSRGRQGKVFIGVELYVRRKDSSIQILVTLISLTENSSSIWEGAKSSIRL
jgi:hypothetical protein